MVTFDLQCDLLLNKHMATEHLLVLYKTDKNGINVRPPIDSTMLVRPSKCKNNLLNLLYYIKL